MRKVCDWQLANSKHGQYDNGYFMWANGALYSGVMATYYTTNDEKYLDAMIECSQANQWKPGSRVYHADDHCMSQTYLEIYSIKKDPKMIAATIETFDKIVADPMRGPVVGWEAKKNWMWNGALFMSPPVSARLSTLTGNMKYIDVMDQMWDDTTELLYDTDEHLFYRDARFRPQPDGSELRGKNGEKLFWSRGNGWSIGGIVRVLEYMPADYPQRPKYEILLKEMAAKLVSTQGSDGFWRASLLDAESYPNPETSGTAFFCYGIAWGINNSILDRDEYLPVVTRAWKGLVGSVHESGKLGWVQSIGEEPAMVTADSTEVYGVGAFLLAGSEVIKLEI